MLYGAFGGDVTTDGATGTNGTTKDSLTAGTLDDGVETGAASGAAAGTVKGGVIGCGTDGTGDIGVTGDTFLGKLGCNPC